MDAGTNGSFEQESLGKPQRRNWPFYDQVILSLPVLQGGRRKGAVFIQIKQVLF
jgi:hypothetical protein